MTKPIGKIPILLSWPEKLPDKWKDGTMENPGNVPAKFQLAFKYHIWFRMKDLINKEDGIVNDNIA